MKEEKMKESFSLGKKALAPNPIPKLILGFSFRYQNQISVSHRKDSLFELFKIITMIMVQKIKPKGAHGVLPKSPLKF